MRLTKHLPAARAAVAIEDASALLTLLLPTLMFSSFTSDSVYACRWLRPTSDRPTVNQFVATLDESGAIFLCTVQHIDAAEWTIDARRLKSDNRYARSVAFTSDNALVCVASSSGVSLIDLHSCRKMKIPGRFLAATFAQDNPYTLLAYKDDKGGTGCFKVGPARLIHQRTEK